MGGSITGGVESYGLEEFGGTFVYDDSFTGYEDGTTVFLCGGTFTNVGSNHAAAARMLRGGTRILTPTGEVPLETLKRRDYVVTRFGELQGIKWIGRQSCRTEAVRDDRAYIAVHLRTGSRGKCGSEIPIVLLW